MNLRNTLHELPVPSPHAVDRNVQETAALRDVRKLGHELLDTRYELTAEGWAAWSLIRGGQEPEA